MTDPVSDDVTLLAEMTKLRAALAVSRKRELFWRAFVLVVLFAGVYFFVGQKHNLEVIVSTRTEARATTCKSDNTFIENHNVLVDAVEQAAGIVSAPNAARTPAQQQAADAFVMEYIAKVEKARVPLRDCSPEAITAFYKEKP